MTRRPLTLRRTVWTCVGLAVVLFSAVLLALRLGAVPFSINDLGDNLWWLVTGQTSKVSTDFWLTANAASSEKVFGLAGKTESAHSALCADCSSCWSLMAIAA